MRRIGKKIAAEVEDRFEAALDYVVALDPVPFHIKREAAEKAAQVALDFIREKAA